LILMPSVPSGAYAIVALVPDGILGEVFRRTAAGVTIVAAISHVPWPAIVAVAVFFWGPPPARAWLAFVEDVGRAASRAKRAKAKRPSDAGKKGSGGKRGTKRSQRSSRGSNRRSR
jgi:hypothetical protein